MSTARMTNPRTSPLTFSVSPFSSPRDRALQRAYHDLTDSITGRQGCSIRIAVDYGTTFSCVAWTELPHRHGQEIKSIGNWPSDTEPGKISRQIPSESGYPTSRTMQTRKRKERPDDDSDSDSLSKSFATKLEPMQYYSSVVQPGYIHGFEVQEQLGFPDPDSDPPVDNKHVRITRAKLLLDTNPVTAKMRASLKSTIDQLIHNRVIKDEAAVIRDYLTTMFLHTKRQLRTRPDAHDGDQVDEIVFCVPACWSPNANAVMVKCINEALRRARFGIRDDGSLPALFMVNEAEAAATNALLEGEYRLVRGETFIILDCGGGTIDAGVYTVANRDPFRLDREVTSPESIMSGSSMINEGFWKLASKDLRGEQYLEQDGITIRSIIDEDLIPVFENTVKRSVDFRDRTKTYSFRIRRLRQNNNNKRIQNGAYVLSHYDMLALFEGCLRAAEGLLKRQVLGCSAKGVQPEKVILAGGFADSPALRIHLRNELSKINRANGLSISGPVVAPYNRSATGVAVGALTRSLDKTEGPARELKMSYGVLRDLPFEPDAIPEFPELAPILEGKVTRNPVTDEEEVANTIDWIMKKGGNALERTHTETFVSRHLFSTKAERWLRYEALYTSETCTKSFFQINHPKNKDKYRLHGKIQLDLDVLKPEIQRTDGYYEIEVLIKMTVIDKNLDFTAHWPANENGSVIVGSQKRFSMLAAFEPGTAL